VSGDANTSAQEQAVCSALSCRCISAGICCKRMSRVHRPRLRSAVARLAQLRGPSRRACYYGTRVALDKESVCESICADHGGNALEIGKGSIERSSAVDEAARSRAAWNRWIQLTVHLHLAAFVSLSKRQLIPIELFFLVS